MIAERPANQNRSDELNRCGPRYRYILLVLYLPYCRQPTKPWAMRRFTGNSAGMECRTTLFSS